jgi:hypothetical protein|tara:strand:- start:4196 stop:4372 length:177 start_codon:yes stop_codon:yes gene_type:complete
MDKIKLKKMEFFYNALENGWEICKKKDNYIFKKKHENKKEILTNTYLSRFMKEQMATK